jgi:hypothetical protein
VSGGRLFEVIDQTLWPVRRWAESSSAVTKMTRSTVGDQAKERTGLGRIPSPTIFILETLLEQLRRDIKGDTLLAGVRVLGRHHDLGFVVVSGDEFVIGAKWKCSSPRREPD